MENIRKNELRIGNWVEFPDCLIKQQQVVYIDARKEDTSYLKPIPLTEEWLEKLGFKVYDVCGFGDEDDYTAYRRHDYDSTGIEMEHLLGKIPNKPFVFTLSKSKGELLTDDWLQREIQYVHQLQNMYWCLCGQELQAVL